MRVTRPAHLIFIGLATLITHDQEYKFWSSSLGIFLQSLVTAAFWIFLNYFLKNSSKLLSSFENLLSIYLPFSAEWPLYILTGLTLFISRSYLVGYFYDFFFLHITLTDFYFCGTTTLHGPRIPHCWGYDITHTDTLHSLGLLWTGDRLVAETTHNILKGQISIPPKELEPTDPTNKLPQIHALDIAAFKYEGQTVLFKDPVRTAQ